MNIMENKFESLIAVPLALGAYKANVIETKEISLDRSFRDMCASNACGVYGKCWMCPPDVGEIDVLMGEVGKYDYALVYQTVTELEDSYDFEGMMEAGARHNQLMVKIRDQLASEPLSRILHLGAGGCRMCEVCGKRTGEPCRHPDLAVASLETYGVNVSKLAPTAGMKYINGQDTVTYFGAVLFDI